MSINQTLKYNSLIQEEDYSNNLSKKYYGYSKAGKDSLYFNDIESRINEKNQKAKVSEFIKYENKILETECETEIKNKSQICVQKTNYIFDIMGKFMPKSRMILPLRFKNKRYFSSRYITFTSIVLFTCIMTGSIITLNNIGTFESYMNIEVLYQNN